MAESSPNPSSGSQEHLLGSADFILSNTLDCIAAVDQDWRYIYLNDRARLAIAGGRDLVGMNFWDAFPGAAGHPLGDAYKKTMSDGVVRELEAFFEPLDQWFACRVVRIAEGVVTFFRVTTRERKQDSALSAISARLQSIFGNLDLGVTVLDSRGFILEANRAAEQLLGIPNDQLCGLSVNSPEWRAIDVNGRQIAAGEFPAMVALRTGTVVRQFVMGVFNPGSGDRRWLSVDAFPIRTIGNAPPSHVYVIFSDITERQEEENELRLSRSFMEIAQRVTSIGSAAIDLRTGKWNWSEETCRIYGVDPHEFMPSAQSIAPLIHPSDREAVLCAPEMAQKGLTPPTIEYRIRRPNGEERLLRRDAVLIYDDLGQVIGVVGAVQDVTDIRAREQEKELLRAQLNHAQRLDALGRFAGGIAHDLNNTLVPVLTLSDVLASSFSENDDRRKLIEMIKRAAERGRDLVRQVLTFTRRDAPNRQRVELVEFLESSMGFIRASIPKTVEVVYRISRVPPIFADPSQIHQVLMNLVANAAHAIGEGRGTIEIALAEGNLNGAPVLVNRAASFAIMSVIDTGCGMDAELQDRVFEPFFTTKGVGVGTGLGLSVVHGIVTAHGGAITVKSAPGAGARFDVYLPFAER